MGAVEQDMFLLDCPTYEDYLDTFIIRNDKRYLRNIRYCRMLVEFGYRSANAIYTPEEYEKRKAAIQEALWPTKRSMAMFFSENMTTQDPVLIELARREKLNAQKMISTIIFMKHRYKSGFEITGYIDYAQSLRQANLQVKACTDWLGVFHERTRLRPKPTDLSFYDWHKGIVYYNNSENYLIIHDVENGLIFEHKGDHKRICVDVTRGLYTDNFTREMHYSERYWHVIFYDHIICT